VRRHFTCTGFVFDGGRTLFLWHRHLRMWVPPGGHLLPDEDPVTGVLREIEEETGLLAEVVPTAPVFPFAYPGQIQPPYTMLLENSAEPGEPHQHIDFIYFCRPRAGARLSPPPGTVLAWATEQDLRQDRPLELEGACGLSVPVPPDVRALALEGFRLLSLKKEGRG
jgi:8-oxo-dGTP pyrophosphatase MutT (NUDIX family)